LAKLFGRKVSLTIGTLEINEEHRISFTVKKTLKPEPNTAAISVWNLNPSQRKELETPLAKGQLNVRLEAGYEDGGLSQLYLGGVRTAQSQSDGADIVTKVETGDGEKEIAKARINVSFGPKTPPGEVLRAIARTLGLGLGNTEKAEARLRARGLASLGLHGHVVSGSSARELTDFCRSAGLEWSVQDGKIQILDVGKPLEDTEAILVSPSTGLIGSPSVDVEGVLEATLLLTPGLRPGVKVALDSREFKGGYRVTQCEYVGDTHDQPWYVKIHAKKY